MFYYEFFGKLENACFFQQQELLKKSGIIKNRDEEKEERVSFYTIERYETEFFLEVLESGLKPLPIIQGFEVEARKELLLGKTADSAIYRREVRIICQKCDKQCSFFAFLNENE